VALTWSRCQCGWQRPWGVGSRLGQEIASGTRERLWMASHLVEGAKATLLAPLKIPPPHSMVRGARMLERAPEWALVRHDVQQSNTLLPQRARQSQPTLRRKRCVGDRQ